MQTPPTPAIPLSPRRVAQTQDLPGTPRLKTKLMVRVDLQSTSLNAATYQEQRAILELEFQSGAVYRYLGVPEPIYRELLNAESKGRYFNQRIRNRFPYAKIDPICAPPVIP
jgi:hypothetical protein